ncbi:hypothetical protein CGMCC3_g5329 [Colletotrichum fructicola]|nr:uncharacterized protein CGMCC3_g5329 [Colletotrichum fructicola]KAE9578808.1 hypothetical protein CGMCC3_g5329 [Colletotrichum fructicola]
MSPSHAIEDYLHVRRWDRRQTQSNEEAQPHRDVSVRSNFQLYLDGPAVQQLQAIDRCRVTEPNSQPAKHRLDRACLILRSIPPNRRPSLGIEARGVDS